jgi:hypothetical protein
MFGMRERAFFSPFRHPLGVYHIVFPFVEFNAGFTKALQQYQGSVQNNQWRQNIILYDNVMLTTHAIQERR